MEKHNSGFRVSCSLAVAAMSVFCFLFVGVRYARADVSGPNLIPNPSLETSASSTDAVVPESWLEGNWGTNAAAFAYPAAGQDGAKAASVQITSYSDGDAKWYFEPVAIAPGSYQFSDYYKSDVTTYIVAQYADAGGALSYAQLATLAPAANWTNATATFTVPAGTAKVTIFHLINSVGTLTVDNYSLQSYSVPPVTPPPPPTADNLILNPSLEYADANGQPAGWLQGNWGTNAAAFAYPAAGQDGAKAASVQITSYSDGDAKWYFEPVAIAPGSYQFSDYYKSDVTTYVVAQYADAGGALSYETLATLAPSANWKKAAAGFTAPSGAAKVTIFHVINAVGNLTVDNFSLASYSVPQPPPPTPDNLIINPSLEYADGGGKPIGWSQAAWGENSPAFTYPVPGYSGNAAMVQITAYTTGDAKWYFDPVAAKSNYRYVFSDYFKSDVQSVVEAQFLMSDNTYQYARLAVIDPAASWKKFAVEFATPANAKSVTIFHLLQSVGSLTVDEYSLAENGSAALSQGMVSLDFDDGWLSAYRNAYPILKQAGLKTTQNLIIDGFSDPANYVTLAQAKAMQTAGSEIGSHSKTHSDLTTLDPTQLADEVSGSKTWLVSKGLNVSTFAYPLGKYNVDVVNAVKAAGYAGARASDPGFNNKVSDHYTLVIQSVENTTTIAQIKSWISSAKQNKTWLILVFHKVLANTSGEQYSTTPSIIRQMATYLVNQKIPVVTNSQGLSVLNQ